MALPRKSYDRKKGGTGTHRTFWIRRSNLTTSNIREKQHRIERAQLQLQRMQASGGRGGVASAAAMLGTQELKLILQVNWPVDPHFQSKASLACRVRNLGLVCPDQDTTGTRQRGGDRHIVRAAFYRWNKEFPDDFGIRCRQGRVMLVRHKLELEFFCILWFPLKRI